MKTETMWIGVPAEFFIDGTKLANVNHFKYLGSYVSSECSMKEELVSRIQATSAKEGFDSHDLTASTKLGVYNQCLMALLMYGSETWTYQHEVRQLRTIQQRHLRLILKIRWDHFISNAEVLKRAGTEDIEVMLVRSRLRWLGHVCRMDDNRPQKQLLYGELASGSRPVGRPKLRVKDSCKSILKSGQSLDTWQTAVKHRTKWCKSINSICECLSTNESWNMREGPADVKQNEGKLC